MTMPQTFVDLVMLDEFASKRAVGDDVGVSEILNVRDQNAGWISPRHILSILNTTGEIGVIDWIWRFGTLPGTDTKASVPLFCLCSSLMNSVKLPEYDFRVPPASLSAGAQVLVPNNLLQQSTVDAVLAGEEKVSRSELTLGRQSSATDIGNIRNGSS